MLLQLISNNFDFNFNKSYITTKSVLQCCIWMNKLNIPQCSFTNSTVSLSNEIPSKQHNSSEQHVSEAGLREDPGN